jgi:EAL domain-containing protein (putative c-di-GMP-specific phosphodiesterase class I)
LPVDELKIDRRFVAGIGVRPEDDALVRAVTGLAADLGLRVVAEGVETAEQARHLLARGCVLGQGHHFLPPLPTARIDLTGAVPCAVPRTVSRPDRTPTTPLPLDLWGALA